MAHKAVSIQVFGKVQGVGFRFYTHRKALELNLKGFVQNRPDGSVYIEAGGQEENIDQFILWCNNGPAWARVSKIQRQELPAIGYEDFRIK
jgi:acylphosphatase